MIGKITSFDPETGTGVIGSEGLTYPFALGVWAEDSVPPEEGDDIRFELEDGKAVRVSLIGAYLEEPKAVKYKYLAAMLSLLFGWAGLARIYLGFYKMGFIQIILTAILIRAGFVVFVPQWGFVEALLLAASKFDRDAKGRLLK